MTDINVDKLIAKARKSAVRAAYFRTGFEAVILRLADALLQERQRAEKAEATLVKAREYIEALSDSPEHPLEAHHRGVLLAILDESPTEREGTA